MLLDHPKCEVWMLMAVQVAPPPLGLTMRKLFRKAQGTASEATDGEIRITMSQLMMFVPFKTQSRY